MSGMECKSGGESVSCVSEGGSSVCEEGGGAGWLTSTPQHPRRPLHHLNTASPRPPLTPYRYHGCKAIPEEKEDQENIDPATKSIQESCASSKSSGMSPENSTAPHTGSGSSPFAYPLIWEASHTTTTTTTPDTKPTGEGSAWRSPVSHYRAECQGAKGVPEEKEGKEGGGKVRNRSGSGGEGSSSKVLCHGPSVTPSKGSLLQPLVNTSSVFLTPSSSMQSTRPGENRGGGGGGGGGQTPKQQRIALSASTHINPFEVGAESLYLSAVSPSLFQQVVSPSQKTDNNFRWSIDQMAALQPVNIETSPFMQVEALVDPDYERRAQDAIDKFFTTHQSVIPSPWTGSNKSIGVVKKVSVQQSQASPSLPPPRTQTVWCQTELSLPPVLPAALEEVLKPFCTFTQNQGWQGGGGGESDEAASLNNTTLRRKLLFGHEDLASNTPSQGGSEPPSPTTTTRSCHYTTSPTQPQPHPEDSQPDEGEESGLVWCTAVLDPGSGVEGGSVMRHSPLTPPCGPALSSTTTTTTTTPTQHPPPDTFAAVENLLHSPDVSPIHHHLFSSDDVKGNVLPCSSLEGSYIEIQHASCTFISPNEVSPSGTCAARHNASPLSGEPRHSGTNKDWSSRSPGSVHTYSPHHSSPHPGYVGVEEGEVHMGTQEEEEEEKDMQGEDKDAIVVNMSESFSSQFTEKDLKLRLQVTSSPSAELRCSSSSGHFSSSPRQDVSHSPLEVDSPGRRFSASPPLSPIFCRPLVFPSHPCPQLHSLPVKERKEGLEVTMMEESSVCVPSATTTALPPSSSSMWDMDMDSQPSVESHLGEETASQDTGYHTASVSSLMGSNYSCTTYYPQDLPHLPPLVETANTNHSHSPSSRS